MTRRTFAIALGALLAVGAVARAAYVLAQPASDPAFARPMLDGAYYLECARDLVAGKGGPPGAYYLAPGYPWLLAGFLAAFGERFGLLYLLQHLAVVGAAGLLALVARRAAGEVAGLAAAALVLLYHPALFFASRPLGEPAALLILAASAWVATTYSSSSNRLAVRAMGTGAGAGVASLLRPNLLLVAALWALLAAIRKRARVAALLVAGTALVVLPVAVRNLAVSGHVVAISSNSGMTLYHGNGPGAEGGFTLPAGFTGTVATQRQEATIASARAGRRLDPVEADGWWGREAIRARLSDPAGTARLVARRALLLLDNAEHGLDYAPDLDENPWRRAAPVPFALIAGLAAAGVVALGFRGSGGGIVWSAILACAATPVLFYASSRYRLPASVLLCVPAGCGLAALAGALEVPVRRRAWAGGACAALLAGSLAVPSADLTRVELSGALANRAVAHRQAGDLGAAERDARRAMELDPSSATARFDLGAVLEAAGRAADAEAAYREALALDAANAEAAGNLAALLILRGAALEAAPILRRALAAHPTHAACRTNLVIALASAGDLEEARKAARDAAEAGIALDAGLLREIGIR